MRDTRFYSLLVVLLGIGIGLAACGGGSSGSGSSPADIRHRIFVTSASFDGNLGGLVGADIVCTNAAAAAGIGGSYRALLSSSAESANTRIVISGEVYMLGAGGEVAVATNVATFWNNDLANPINIDENRAMLVAMEEPWTGTNPGGGTSGIGLTCLDWTDGSGGNLGSTGDTSTTTSALWVNANGYLCSDSRRLYCIEE